MKRIPALLVFFILLFVVPSLGAGYSDGMQNAGEKPPQEAKKASSTMWVTAYYGFWWQYGVPPWKIPWNSITHVVHFVGGSNTNGTYPYFSVPKEYELGANGVHYQDSLIAIAHRNGVKVLLDLGYNMFGGFDKLCALGDGAISDWAHTVKNYMFAKGYDGCDIDFEPAPGPVQREQWGRMLHILRDTLNTLSPRGILTCAVMQYYSINFNPDSLAQLCDQINLMEYDQAGSWNSGSGHNSPLYKNPSVPGGDDSSGIVSWLANNGTIPASKIGFGMALYGRLFFGIAQANQTPNNNYQYRWYNDIVKKDIPSPGASVVWDDVARVPAVVDPNQMHWLTYDDTTSLRLKVEFAKRQKLGGIMLFGLGEGYIYDPTNGRDPNELAIAVGRAVGLSYSSIERMPAPQSHPKEEAKHPEYSGGQSAEDAFPGNLSGGPHADAWPDRTDDLTASGGDFDGAEGGVSEGGQATGGSTPVRSAASSQTYYWHTVHYANWEHYDITPQHIPWQSITNLIHFAGNTLGNQTNATYPYWDPPSNWELDAGNTLNYHFGDTLRAYGAKYGVIIEIDAGFNSSNQYYDLCLKGDTAIATWAGQVGHYMANWNYGGIDFDLEGGGYPVNYGFQKMVQFLRDTLAALTPGKKYYFTASVMPNPGDQTGWGIVGGPNPAINLMDQINPMFYDVSGTFGSPLYKDPNCSTWGSDSSVAISLLGVGIPASKLGLGYNIQVYHTQSTTACPPGGFGYISKLMSEIQYFPPATGATIYWDDVAKESYMINTSAGVKVAYEDTLSTWYKADFIKRHSLGGIMGFCLGRGYLPNPPAGWRHNEAVEGMGVALFGNSPPPPPPPPPTPQIVVTLQGRVFFDADSDHVKDTTESGIPGWKVWLRRTSPDTAIYWVVSDAIGMYSFDSLPAGVYAVSQDPRPAAGDPSLVWTQTYPASPGTYALNITGSTTISALDFGNYTPGAFNFLLAQGWNLISLPLRVTKPAVRDLFPNALGSAFDYNGSLVLADTLTTGLGYWLRSPSDQNVLITGLQNSRDTVNVMGDWNLIGALSTPMAVSTVTSLPGGIIGSRFFGYGSTYTIVDSLKPGRGYWVKCTAGGQLVFSSSAAQKIAPSAGIDELSGMNTLTFRTSSGNHQTLYFSSDPARGATAAMYEMPPLIDGLFDVRFSTSPHSSAGSMVWCAGSADQPGSSWIAVRSPGEAVDLEWHMAEPGIHPVLEFAQGGSVQLVGDGSVNGQLPASALAQGPVVLRLRLPASVSHQIPEEFRVYQNYPNPFNPSTIIRFDLPAPARVTVTIYNLLGSRVGDVLANSLDAGRQSVTIDGSQLPSGIYFCRVRADFQQGASRTETLRMMLLK